MKAQSLLRPKDWKEPMPQPEGSEAAGSPPYSWGSSYLDMFQKDSYSSRVEAGLDVHQNSLKTGALAGRLTIV